MRPTTVVITPAERVFDVRRMRSWRVSAVALLCALAGCSRNPATGALQLDLVPQDQEIAMGKQAADEVASTVGIYDDPALETYVADIGQRLAATSERPKLPWTFRVVDDEAVNAFALPGGYIFVTRGLLTYLQNESQLACVVGHEIGHVTAEHSVNQMSKAQLAQIGIGVGAALSKTIQQWAPLGMAGLQLLFLKFGRDDERESDRLGIRYAVRGGYDPRQMPRVFGILDSVSRQHQEGSPLPAWLSTHPAPKDRIEATSKQLAALDQNLAGLVVGEERLMQAVDGLVYGGDPREGYFEGRRFIHPGLAFRIDLPEGWQHVNTKEAVVASSPEGDAAVKLTPSAQGSPELAMEAFARESGAQLTARPVVYGEALVAPFQADTEQGPLAGVSAFVLHRGHTLAVLGLGEPTAAQRHEATFLAVIKSFGEVDAPAALRKAPRRIRVRRLAQATDMHALQRSHPGLSLEELALLNQVAPDAQLPEGKWVKWVE